MLFSGTGKFNTDEGIGISCNDYNNGYALYAFNLTSDLDDDAHFNLVRHGNVRLALKFSTVFPTMAIVIAYAEFDNVIELDCDCNMLVDFEI